MMNKKGQVNTLAPAILALVFAAIVLVFGIIISQSLTNTTEGDVLTSAANESIDAFTGTDFQTLDGAGTCGFGSVSTASVVIYNVTGDVLILDGNYTVFSNGSIQNDTETHSIWGWQVSYPYTWGDEACSGGNKTTVGLGTFADFWEIIVLAIVITVVIGLLLIVFGGRRTR